jgi:hypothetical protein
VELRNPPYDYAGALEAANSRPGDALLFLTSPFLAPRRLLRRLGQGS